MVKNNYGQPEQDDPYRAALINQMRTSSATGPAGQTAPGMQASPYEAGGITGGAKGPIDPTAPADKPDYTALGQYKDRLGAYTADKFTAPYDQRSEKYQIGTVLSHFNANEGITPAVLEALNQANIHGAKFSGSGDKLTLDNAGGYDRFGKGGTSDIIQGFNDPNNTNKNWGAWFVDDNGQPQQQGAPGMAPGGGAGGPLGAIGALQQLGQGNVLQRIQAALSHYLGQPGQAA